MSDMAQNGGDDSPAPKGKSGSKPPRVFREGRVLAGGSGVGNVFARSDGKRSDYGTLILNALTGMTTEQLEDSIRREIGAGEYARLSKQMAEGGEIFATLLDSEDQFFTDYLSIQGGPNVLAPPISPERLTRLVLENNAVESCISVMVTNVSGTGFSLVPSHVSEADLTDAQKEQRRGLMEFFSEVYARQSFAKVRKALRRDLHTTGNSYAVVERTMNGEVAFLRRAPAKSMRLVKLDEPVRAEIVTRRGGREVTLTTTRAERRFIQKIGTKRVFYKEFGASRDLNRNTGEWAKPGERLPPQLRAHEVIHEKDLEDTRSPYGVPRWITQLPSVLGSRMAEEHNLAFFHTGGMPPVIIFVSGGIVSEQVQKALNDYLTGSSSSKQRGVAVEIPASGSLDREQPATIQVERFGSDTADGTFESYDKNSEIRIRRAFRLPGIFLGYSDSYNYATAHAAYAVCEEQVFKPERDDEDELWNMTIMRELDPSGTFEIVSNPLSVKDVTLRLRGAELLRDITGISLKSWVDTVNKATGNEIELTEDYEETVIGEDGSAVVAPGDSEMTPPPEPSGQPEQSGRSAAPQATATGGPSTTTGASPHGVSGPGGARVSPVSTVKSTAQREAQRIALRISRAIRDYEDTGDTDGLHRILMVEQEYDAADQEVRGLTDEALSRMMFTSPFLVDAGLIQDFSIAYAKSAFAEARRRLRVN